MFPVLEMIEAGMGVSIQDLGRPGYRRFGVPPGGALDRYSFKMANRLAGNVPVRATLEILFQGALFKVLEPGWFALSGAHTACCLDVWTAEYLEKGSMLDFRKNYSGLINYLSIPGGFISPTWLGSQSMDSRIGFGTPLEKGTLLYADENSFKGHKRFVSKKWLLPQLRRDFNKKTLLKIQRGPQFELFSESARKQLVTSAWMVSHKSDKTGFRLEGPPLEIPHSIESEAVLPGSFQVPGNGQPIVTMNAGPTVGGYPKLAILLEEELDWFAQAKPGTNLRFQWVD